MRVSNEQAIKDKECGERSGCIECPHERPEGCMAHNSSFHDYAADLLEARAMIREIYKQVGYTFPKDLAEKCKEYAE